MTLKTVKLKNGEEEAEGLVNITFMLLKDLSKNNPILLYELAEKCRDRNHKFFGNTGDTLREKELVQSDYSMHSSIKNIVLSSIEGEGMEMRLVNPI